MRAGLGGIRPYRVLVVEHNRRSFDELRETLVDDGHECELVLDMDMARSVLAERRMDVAVINAQLIEQPEQELVERLKEDSPHMRLVLYNGTAQRNARRRLRRRGVDSYLTQASDLGAAARSVRRVIREKL